MQHVPNTIPTNADGHSSSFQTRENLPIVSNNSFTIGCMCWRNVCSSKTSLIRMAHILCPCNPFKISHSIVVLIAILVIHKRLAIWVI